GRRGQETGDRRQGIERGREGIGLVSTQYSVLGTQYLALSTWHSVLGTSGNRCHVVGPPTTEAENRAPRRAPPSAARALQHRHRMSRRSPAAGMVRAAAARRAEGAVVGAVMGYARRKRRVSC